MHILVGSYLIIATYVTASELPCFKLRNRRIPHIGNSHEQYVRIEVVAERSPYSVTVCGILARLRVVPN